MDYAIGMMRKKSTKMNTETKYLVIGVKDTEGHLPSNTTVEVNKETFDKFTSPEFFRATKIENTLCILNIKYIKRK